MSYTKKQLRIDLQNSLIQLHHNYWPKAWGGIDPGDYQDAFLRLKLPFIPPETLLYLLDGALGVPLTNYCWFQRLFKIHEHPEPKTSAIAARAYRVLSKLELAEFRPVHTIKLCDYIWSLRSIWKKYPSWGSSFTWRTSEGLVFDSGGPSVLVTAIVGLAFIDAYKVSMASRFLEYARAAAQYIMYDNGYVQHEDDSLCFFYSPMIPREITNASAFAALFLKSLSEIINDETMASISDEAYRFIFNVQNEDGSWLYYPFRDAARNIVDSYHTGFVLQALLELQSINPSRENENALRKGLEFYGTLFEANGRPHFNIRRRYPIDIHDIAQGLLVNSMASSILGTNLRKALCIWRFAEKVMKRDDGRYSSRIYRLGRSNLSTPRWADSWMFEGIAELLYALQ